MLRERLSKLSAASFDKVYMQNMVMDHKADIAEFKRESNSGTDSAVKQFATSTLPTLQSHLEEAGEIAPTNMASLAKPSPMQK